MQLYSNGGSREEDIIIHVSWYWVYTTNILPLQPEKPYSETETESLQQ